MKRTLLLLSVLTVACSVGHAQLMGSCGTLSATVTTHTFPAQTIPTPTGPVTFPAQTLDLIDFTVTGLTTPANPWTSVTWVFADLNQLSAPDPLTGLSLDVNTAFPFWGWQDFMTGDVFAFAAADHNPAGTATTVYAQAVTIDFSNPTAVTWCVSNVTSFTLSL